MKKITLRITAVAMVFCATAAFSQSKYSGIYKAKAGGNKILLALTKGGRALGADDQAEGLRDILDPAKSKVSKKGKLTGKTPAGASVAATISSSGKLTGTVKTGDGTFRFSGKRIYK